MNINNYSDQFCDWLIEEGFTHCFFVAGGNIMHLLNSARTRFNCIPVVHEVSAAIATEYFNETSNAERAFALVTAGPGATNTLTGVAGAWLESRELLVIGGQVKSSDLKSSKNIRQTGIQEVDGLSLMKPITKGVLQIRKPVKKNTVLELIEDSRRPRKGPVFIEFCLDAQASSPLSEELFQLKSKVTTPRFTASDKYLLRKYLKASERPVILLGGGVSRNEIESALEPFERLKIPILTTWNGADRIGSDNLNYFGRPNTWGQRSANVIIQQSDLIIAFGTRLGIQQTGFNRQGFAPLAKIIQFDIDKYEIKNNSKLVDLGIQVDATFALTELVKFFPSQSNFDSWYNFASYVKDELPLNESCNTRDESYVNPYDFVELLSELLLSNDVIIPCSSGGAFTTMMQAFKQKFGQKIVTNKGLASMGYGLAGAIGAALSNNGKRIVLVEGDGGFTQNLQELGTVAALNLPIKIFIFENNGYASIRMTQENYFGGAYVGCDNTTGLGLPNWSALFNSYSVSNRTLESTKDFSPEFIEELNDNSPRAFIIKLDPRQTYFPKITSKILPNGKMESNPIHLMSPPLDESVSDKVFKYIQVD